MSDMEIMNKTRIDNLEVWMDELERKERVLSNRLDRLESNVNYMVGRLKDLESKIKEIENRLYSFGLY